MKLIITLILLFISNLAFALKLTSPGFDNNQFIPMQYTCEADNYSPALSWQDPPAGTASYALIMHDPDAPNGHWVHWVLYNISTTTTSLPENFQAVYSSAKIGKNSWGKQLYGGPCPPSGTHRYVFTLYALDISLDNQPQGLTETQLLDAMKGHVLGQAQLIGKYGM